MFRRLLKLLMLEPPATDRTELVAGFDIPDQIQEIRGRYAIARRIEGHPDVHNYLWHRAGAELPADTRWIVRAHAAIAHPKTRIIFAIASGTHSIQIKIPAFELNAFPELQPADCNREVNSFVWISSRLNEGEDKQLLQIAFVAAGAPT